MSTLSQFVGAFSSQQTIVDILIVGGGGGADSLTSAQAYAAGGGGAGQLVYLSQFPIATGISLVVTVGAGGASATSGNQSSLGPLLVAAGGGPGSTQTWGNHGIRGPLGEGSSGGYSSNQSSKTMFDVYPLPSTSALFYLPSNPRQSVRIAANKGGSQFGDQYNSGVSGAGGGAGGVGGTSTGGSITPSGGLGLSFDITGTNTTYAEGAAGRTQAGGTQAGVAGTANTGNGGRGGMNATSVAQPGGNGGSGVVIIAYRDTLPAPAAISGTYDTPSRSGYRVYRFTGSGSITF